MVLDRSKSIKWYEMGLILRKTKNKTKLWQQNLVLSQNPLVWDFEFSVQKIDFCAWGENERGDVENQFLTNETGWKNIPQFKRGN